MNRTYVGKSSHGHARSDGFTFFDCNGWGRVDRPRVVVPFTIKQPRPPGDTRGKD